MPVKHELLTETGSRRDSGDHEILLVAACVDIVLTSAGDEA
jgi:hypothetical protein